MYYYSNRVFVALDSSFTYSCAYGCDLCVPKFYLCFIILVSRKYFYAEFIWIYSNLFLIFGFLCLVLNYLLLWESRFHSRRLDLWVSTYLLKYSSLRLVNVIDILILDSLHLWGASWLFHILLMLDQPQTGLISR